MTSGETGLQEQKPFIRVFFDQPPGTVYRPDDTVSGLVFVFPSSAVSITVRHATVSLWGASKVWIRTKTSTTDANKQPKDLYYHYRDQVTLFLKTISLGHESLTIAAGSRVQAWRFSFRMPRATGFNRTGCYSPPYPKNRAYDPSTWTELSHDLPPTFSLGLAKQPDCCFIYYGITAELRYEVERGPDSLHDSVNNDASQLVRDISSITFAGRPVREAAEITFTFTRTAMQCALDSSSLLSQDRQTIGFRQRLRDRFSSSTPPLIFELGLELPKELVEPDTDFPFRCTFAVLEGDMVESIPPVTFRILELTLSDLTSFRAPRDYFASDTSSGYATTVLAPRILGRCGDELRCVVNRVPLNAVPGTRTVELGTYTWDSGEKGKDIVKQEKQCEAWFSGRVPTDTGPSLRSFAIRVAYYLKAKVRVEVGGKGYEIEAGW